MATPLAFSAQKQCACVLATWLFVVLLMVVTCTAHGGNYLRWGPDAALVVFGLVIDTWVKWGFLMCFVLVTQSLQVLSDETISPFILNTIMDHKDHTTLFSYAESQMICQSYYLFSAVAKLVHVAIAISQVDFVIAVIATNIMVSCYTTHVFLQAKKRGGDCECALLHTPLQAPAGEDMCSPEDAATDVHF
jgi:hypothetical protein